MFIGKLIKWSSKLSDSGLPVDLFFDELSPIANSTGPVEERLQYDIAVDVDFIHIMFQIIEVGSDSDKTS